MSTPQASNTGLPHDVPWLTHVLIGLLPVALAGTFFSREKLLFGGHVLAMSAGCIFFMSEGIIAARNAKVRL
jgi:hypothetical protein